MPGILRFEPRPEGARPLQPDERCGRLSAITLSAYHPFLEVVRQAFGKDDDSEGR